MTAERTNNRKLVARATFIAYRSEAVSVITNTLGTHQAVSLKPGLHPTFLSCCKDIRVFAKADKAVRKKKRQPEFIKLRI